MALGVRCQPKSFGHQELTPRSSSEATKMTKTYRRQLQVLKNVVKEVVFGELEFDHFMLQLDDSANHVVQHMAQQSSLLSVSDLIVAFFQAPKSLHILDIHGGQELKSRQLVLQNSSIPITRN